MRFTGYARRVRQRLRDDLKRAIKAQDQLAVRALRTALGAIDNAEAVGTASERISIMQSEHVAGAAAGAYSADVPRRELSEAEVALIVRQQVEDRRRAAAQYEQLGRAEESDRLAREAELLDSYLT